MLLSGLRILVVDDYEPLQFLKMRLLQRAGAEVQAAWDGREALTILEEGGIDLALLDINLPDMSAVELRKRIRAGASSPNVALIFTSASERSGELEESEVFLQEPIDADTLVEAVRREVARARSAGPL